MRIEVRYWEGCPSHPEALELLEEVLRERGVDAEIELREVTTEEEAQELLFPGSPTILVDGRDVDLKGAGQPARLACRIYQLPNGKVSPIPSREQLEAALR